MSSRARLWIDGVALTAVLLTLASGVMLLLAFHVGGRCCRPEALGWSRLAWQNIHRICSVAVLVSVAAHGAVHHRSIGARIRRTLHGAAKNHDPSEIVFYATFAAVAVTGFAVWLFVAGSLPLFGPARLGPIAHERHRWIDLHNVAGVASLYLTVNHVRRHWNGLRALVRRALSRPSRASGTLATRTERTAS
jgi:hypothetical protein